MGLLWPALLCAGRNLGVVVGVADYPSGIPDLKYTDDDAIAVWTSLASDSSWADEDVILLLDNAATKENVAAFIEQHASGMAEGDTLLLYFAGHGTVGLDLPPLDEDDGLDEYLCLYGASTEAFLRDDELVALFAPCGGGKIVVVLDNRYSGGQFGAVRSINTASAPDEHDGFADDLTRSARRPGAAPKDLVDLIQPIVALAACGEAEYSWEFGAPKSHGLFTYYFLEGLRGGADSSGDRDGRVTAEECFAYCAPRVDEISVVWGLNQHPEMLDLLAGSADLVESQAPTAAFSAERAREQAPSPCVFDPSASRAAEGRLLVSFAWSFGDGVSLVQTGPAQVAHVYTTASEREEFEASLAVQDNAGGTDTTRATVVVTNCQPLAGFEWRTGGEALPWAVEDIVADTDQPEVVMELRSAAPIWTAPGAGLPLPCASTPVNYVDHNLSYDPEGQGAIGDGWGVVSYEVNFGDGTTIIMFAGAAGGQLDELSHTYSQLPGGMTEFVVTVTAADELGGSGSWSRRLTIKSGADGCDETCVTLPTPGWSMIALPGAICGTCRGSGDLGCALCDDLDPCLLFRHESAEGRYLAFPRDGEDPYAVGAGLWVYASAPADLCLMTMAPTDAVPVSLRIGWNQIGNPFPFPVGLSDLRVTYEGTAVSLEQAEKLGWVRMYLFGYDRAARLYPMMSPSGGGELGPAEGYWLLSHVECELLVPPVLSQGFVSQHGQQFVGATAQTPDGIPSPPAPPTVDLASASILKGLLITNEPNPARSEHTTTFRVAGPKAELVSAIRVEIYDLSGRLVLE
jgi:hypothetical protein